MAKTNEALQIAINFLNLDIPSARTGDVLNAKEDLLNIVFGEQSPGKISALVGDHSLGKHGSDGLEIDSGELAEIQRAGKTLFAHFVEARDRQRVATKLSEYAGGCIYLSKTMRSQLALVATDSSASVDKPRGVVWVDTLREAFTIILFHLTLSEYTGNVRQCVICKKLFVRTGRKEYDSRQCASIASSRRWRAGKK